MEQHYTIHLNYNVIQLITLVYEKTNNGNILQNIKNNDVAVNLYNKPEIDSI